MARTSKTEIILQGARERLAKAEHAMNQAQNDFDIAQQVVSALRIEYDALANSLARVRSPKSATAPAAKTRSPRNKSVDSSPVSTGDGLESVTTVSKCAVPNCGQPEGATIHDPEWGIKGYHVFHAEIKKRGKVAPSKTVLPDNPEEFVHGASA